MLAKYCNKSYRRTLQDYRALVTRLSWRLLAYVPIWGGGFSSHGVYEVIMNRDWTRMGKVENLAYNKATAVARYVRKSALY
jgi:hypothetical protein